MDDKADFDKKRTGGTKHCDSNGNSKKVTSKDPRTQYGRNFLQHQGLKQLTSKSRLIPYTAPTPKNRKHTREINVRRKIRQAMP